MAEVVFEDLSGAGESIFSNPYDSLIVICNDEPVSFAAVVYGLG